MGKSTDKSYNVTEEETDGVPCLCSKRWILAYMGMIAALFWYALRVNMSVAIVCMVKTVPDNKTANASSIATCVDDTRNGTANEHAEFDWDKSIQSMILATIFYGYLVTQVPAGWLAGRFGGKRVVGIGLGMSGALTLLIPVAARTDYRIVYGLRVVIGLCVAVLFPGIQSMWGRWAPPLERSKLISFALSGNLVGNIITFAISGLLCQYGFDNGWGSIFYLTGGMTFVWLAGWCFLVYDTPNDHPTISEAERKYILSSIGYNPSEAPDHKQGLKVPWGPIFRSRALWACLTAHVCNNWTNYTLVTALPSFMKEVLHFDIKENGALSAVPYVTMLVATLLVGHVVDWLREGRLSTKAARRGVQVISFVGMGACLVGVGFIPCERRMVAVALMSTATFFQGFCFSGYNVNHVDFAPRYAGVLSGITNCVATVPGMVAPLVAGALTPNKTQEEWRNVFYVCAAFCVVGAVAFGFFAQTDVQTWALEEGQRIEVEVEEKEEEKADVDYTNPASTQEVEMSLKEMKAAGKAAWQVD